MYAWHPHGFISYVPSYLMGDMATSGAPHGRVWYGTCSQPVALIFQSWASTSQWRTLGLSINEPSSGFLAIQMATRLLFSLAA